MNKIEARKEIKPNSKIIESIKLIAGNLRLALNSVVFVNPGSDKYGKGDVTTSDYGALIYSSVLDIEGLVDHPHSDISGKSTSILRYFKNKCQEEFIKENPSLMLSTGAFFLEDLIEIDKKNGSYGPKSLQERYLSKLSASMKDHRAMAILKISFNASPDSISEYEISFESGVSFVIDRSGNPSMKEGESIIESTFIYSKTSEVTRAEGDLVEKISKELHLHSFMLPKK